jgi:lysophospholipid acyltransferase (LPLAT)-like uncharacterized protein
MKSLNYLMAYAFGWFSRIFSTLLFSTCRVKVFGQEIEKKHREQYPGKGLLYASWHRGLFFLIYFYRNLKFVVMASASRDGELAAQTTRRHGWIPIRGSSSFRGSEALREMLPLFKKGHRGGLVVDAPQGPPFISKMGIIVLAKRTGLPIIPVIWSADRCWRLRSWDRTIIPKPFSKIVFLYAPELIKISPDASRDDCAAYRQKLDTILNRLMYQTDRFFISPEYTDPRQIVIPDPLPDPDPSIN